MVDITSNPFSSLIAPVTAVPLLKVIFPSFRSIVHISEFLGKSTLHPRRGLVLVRALTLCKNKHCILAVSTSILQCFISTTSSATRVARVRAEYPNQLDYSGCYLYCNVAFLNFWTAVFISVSVFPSGWYITAAHVFWSSSHQVFLR